MVPVFLCNPFVALFLMSALRPLPQAFVYLIVNPAEHLGGHDISLVIHPAPDNGIELAYQRFLDLLPFMMLRTFSKNDLTEVLDGLMSSLPLYFRMFLPRKSKPSSI